VDGSANRGDEAREERHETPLEQLDRNWAELMQELRVAQTGVQLLTGFLLTLPFQSRFTDLSDLERATYLVTMASAVLSTAFLIAPVSLHRMLFRRHARRATVHVGHYLALIGMLLLAIAIVGVVLLIFSVVLDAPAGAVAAIVIGAVLLLLWLVLPLRVRATQSDPADEEHVSPPPQAPSG